MHQIKTFFFILLNKFLARGCDEDTWLTCERLAGCKWAEKGPGILSGGDGTQLQHGTKTFTERWRGGGWGVGGSGGGVVLSYSNSKQRKDSWRWNTTESQMQNKDGCLKSPISFWHQIKKTVMTQMKHILNLLNAFEITYFYHTCYNSCYDTSYLLSPGEMVGSGDAGVSSERRMSHWIFLLFNVCLSVLLGFDYTHLISNTFFLIKTPFQ